MVGIPDLCSAGSGLGLPERPPLPSTPAPQGQEELAWGRPAHTCRKSDAGQPHLGPGNTLAGENQGIPRGVPTGRTKVTGHPQKPAAREVSLAEQVGLTSSSWPPPPEGPRTQKARVVAATSDPEPLSTSHARPLGERVREGLRTDSSIGRATGPDTPPLTSVISALTVSLSYNSHPRIKNAIQGLLAYSQNCAIII